MQKKDYFKFFNFFSRTTWYFIFNLAFILFLIMALIYNLIEHTKVINGPLIILRQCQVCFYREPNFLLRPCNHLNICKYCFDFQRRITNRCQTCRTTIKKFTKVFIYWIVLFYRIMSTIFIGLEFNYFNCYIKSINLVLNSHLISFNHAHMPDNWITNFFL